MDETDLQYLLDQQAGYEQPTYDYYSSFESPTGYSSYAQPDLSIFLDNTDFSGLGSTGQESNYTYDLNMPFNWGYFDLQAGDYLSQAYPELMNTDAATEWQLNAIGQDALYNTLKEQVDQGLLTAEEAQRVLDGTSADGTQYDFKSPEQEKAMSVQKAAMGLMKPSFVASASSPSAAKDYAKLLQQAAQKKAYEQLQAKQAYANSGIGKALSGLSMAALLAKTLTGKNQAPKVAARDNQGQAFAPTYQGASAPKTKYASGGEVHGGLLSLAAKMAREMASQKGLIGGEAGGQDDVVDIKAAPGEYVMDAEVVSALGDGNNEEGARKLDQMRVNVRKHKRTGGLSSIPPKAKKPEQYMKKGK